MVLLHEDASRWFSRLLYKVLLVVGSFGAKQVIYAELSFIKCLVLQINYHNILRCTLQLATLLHIQCSKQGYLFSMKESTLGFNERSFLL